MLYDFIENGFWATAIGGFLLGLIPTGIGWFLDHKKLKASFQHEKKQLVRQSNLKRKDELIELLHSFGSNAKQLDSLIDQTESVEESIEFNKTTMAQLLAEKPDPDVEQAVATTVQRAQRYRHSLKEKCVELHDEMSRQITQISARNAKLGDSAKSCLDRLYEVQLDGVISMKVRMAKSLRTKGLNEYQAAVDAYIKFDEL